MKFFKEIILFVFLGLLIVGVFAHFGTFFHYEPSSTDLVGWMNTAVYFNNVFTPVFLLISVVLLYWTWRDTKRGLNLQRSDVLYTSLIGTLERASMELKNELSNQKIEKLADSDVKACIELLGSTYINERQKRHLDNNSVISFENRITFIDLVRRSTTQINAFAAVINQLYLPLTNSHHKNAFKVNLYSLHSMSFLVGLLMIEIRVKMLYKELEDPDFEELDQIIELLKETISLSHKGKGLEEELFDVNFLEEFFN